MGLWFWAAWLAVGAIVEAWGIARKSHGDTFSEFTRSVLVNAAPRLKWWTLAGYVALAVWFGIHIWG